MDSLPEIRALVAEIEEATAAAQARAQARENSLIVERIKPDLGTLTVDGYGNLISVDLDRRAIRYTTESALAAAVTAAIRTAEQRTRTR